MGPFENVLEPVTDLIRRTPFLSQSLPEATNSHDYLSTLSHSLHSAHNLSLSMPELHGKGQCSFFLTCLKFYV
mgnify:CR=1 FL=1